MKSCTYADYTTIFKYHSTIQQNPCLLRNAECRKKKTVHILTNSINHKIHLLKNIKKFQIKEY